MIFLVGESEAVDPGAIGLNSAQRVSCQSSMDEAKAVATVDVSAYDACPLESATWSVTPVKKLGKRKVSGPAGIYLVCRRCH